MNEDSSLIVVGAGFAGWAACQAALDHGCSPLWLSTGCGASAQSSGAADFWPWTEPTRAQSREELQALEFARRWGIFTTGPDYVSTQAGLIRPTLAVGKGVLGLNAYRGREVGVADWGRDSFRAVELAESLNRDVWSLESKTRFKAVPFERFAAGGLSSVPLGALTSFFEEPEKQAQLLEELGRIRSSMPELSALLFEPILPSTLLEECPLPIGETLSPPEGGFGRRVAPAQTQWAESHGISLRGERVLSFQQEPESLRLLTQTTSGEKVERKCAAVVVATGGLLGGGTHIRTRSAHESALELRAELVGSERVPSGDVHGWDPTAEAGAWIAERGGVAQAGGDERVVFAGELSTASQSPQGTVLGAIASGIAATESLLSRSLL